MRNHLPKAIGALAFLATLSTLPGCRFFDIGNPILPKARVFAESAPSTIGVKVTYRRGEDAYSFEADELTVNVRSYPRDASPGVLINGYSAEYFDQANNPIPTLVLSKVNFGVSGYMEPSSGTTPGKPAALKLPVYNQQVQLYAVDQVFLRAPEVSLNPNLIHSINCRVTLYGEDDNYNQIQIPIAVPISFQAEITQ